MHTYTYRRSCVQCTIPSQGEPWDGAVRVAAFVAGGMVPPARRGTVVSAFISVADWYPTFLSLAGLSPNEIADDVEYNGAMRSLDGINAWPTIIGDAESLGREVRSSNVLWTCVL